ncbi:hypothetical protein [Vibrio parahaemolyticus]|nr:hypothetical protein [Vibrio parahaemolyticus]
MKLYVNTVLVKKPGQYKPNAALSGEQRQPPNLNHCTLNTKFNLK